MASTATAAPPTVTPSAPTPSATALKPVLEAMRDVNTAQDLWILSEALVRLIPKGRSGFDTVASKAAEAGVLGGLSGNTLRVYRDTANLWPKSKRIDGVSYWAHKEAMRNQTDVDKAAALLTKLATTPDAKGRKGPDRVTLSRVKQAASLGSKKGPGAVQKAKPNVRSIDLLADLLNGAPSLIAAVTTSTTSEDLDKLQSGLDKASAHVTRLRSKAAQKAKSKANKASAPAEKSAPVKASAPAQKRRGIRGA